MDGTDFMVQERAGNDWTPDDFSHKFRHAGLRYMIAVALGCSKIVRIAGGLPAGANPDIGTYEIDESVNSALTMTDQAISVFPNPATDFLEIRLLGGYTKNDLHIHDSRGCEVLQEEFRGGKFVLNTSQFHSGIYFIRILQDGNPTLTKKIILH